MTKKKSPKQIIKIKSASRSKVAPEFKPKSKSKILFIIVSLLAVAVFYSSSQKSGTAGIQVTSSGDANVEINGKPVGKTPYYVENISTGPSEVKITEISSKQVWSEKVNLVAGTLTTVHQEFNEDKNKFTSYILNFEKLSDAKAATVSIAGNPSTSAVTVDGKPQGFTPVNFELVPGPHVFTFTSPGYEDKIINAATNEGYQLNIKFSMAANNSVPEIAIDNKFPILDIPADYFDAKNLSRGAGNDYNVLTDAVPYKSYPSTNISLSPESYSVTPKDLPPIKSYSQMHTANPEDDFFGSSKQASIRKYGSIASRYTGGPGEGILIHDIKYADLDKDSKNETIVYISETGANVGTEWVVVIKDNKEIFSTSNFIYSTLIPAKNGNGFSLEWSETKKYDGYMTTKFVFEDGKFVPIYEQLTRYIRVPDSFKKQ